jgi:serine/threonine protein kinase
VKAFDLVLAENEKLPPWLIMEYITQSLSAKDVDDADVSTVLIHLSSALACMHANNITHRDVKPANILVEQNEQGLVAKLADFGTAVHHGLENMETFTGTSVYMAPEFWKRPLRYTNKVDLFSLGLVGVQCLTTWDPPSDEIWTSHPPSTPLQHGRWMRKVILPHVANVPEKFRPLLRGLLRRKPEKRWTATKCLKWLWKITQADTGIDGGPGVEGSEDIKGGSASENPTEVDKHTDIHRGFDSSKKRPASTLSEDDLPSGDFHRNCNASMSTNHAQDRAPRPDALTTLPDTLPWGPLFPASPSPSWAPTPHFDGVEFPGGANGEEEESTDNDTEIEDDWDEGNIEDDRDTERSE